MQNINPPLDTATFPYREASGVSRPCPSCVAEEAKWERHLSRAQIEKVNKRKLKVSFQWSVDRQADSKRLSVSGTSSHPKKLILSTSWDTFAACYIFNFALASQLTCPVMRRAADQFPRRMIAHHSAK